MTPTPEPLPPQHSDAQLWRATDVFRGAAWIFAVGVFLTEQDWYDRPTGAGLVLAVMGLWSVLLATLPVPRRGSPRWLSADLVLTILAVLSSAAVQTPAGVDAGAHTVPTIWAAAPVLSAAIAWGWRGGALSAAAVSAADLVVIGRPNDGTVYAIVLLLLAGGVIGYAVQVLREGRRELARAAALEAAQRERERLARDIHDSVLQVLAYVSRRGAEVGGEAGELARLAGEQEARLRSLVGRGAASLDGEVRADGWSDLGAAVAALTGDRVQVTGPADPVLLAPEAARALLAAAGEALANVRRHAGADAHAWVLLEDEPDRVTLSVRDDGAGIAAGRLDDAEREGRLGVASSIRGRIADVGGRVEIFSRPGEGTEVEMSVPRRAAAGQGHVQ